MHRATSRHYRSHDLHPVAARAAPPLLQKLFKYIDGGNEEGVKIPMTSPVLVEARPSCGPFCKQNFTVNFFVPFHLHDNTPAPLDPSIKIVCSEPFTAYVAQSGGFVLDDYSVERMAKALTEVRTPPPAALSRRLAPPPAAASPPPLALPPLLQALDAEGVDFQDEHFYVAGYDPPFRLQGRHNEVWVKATAAADQDTAQE
jgi:hypothetical protein